MKVTRTHIDLMMLGISLIEKATSTPNEVKEGVNHISFVLRATVGTNLDFANFMAAVGEHPQNREKIVSAAKEFLQKLIPYL